MGDSNVRYSRIDTVRTRGRSSRLVTSLIRGRDRRIDSAITRQHATRHTTHTPCFAVSVNSGGITFITDSNRDDITRFDIARNRATDGLSLSSFFCIDNIVIGNQIYRNACIGRQRINNNGVLTAGTGNTVFIGI